ncbi:hypothetical protein ABEB36_000798 [Hypothenemus hampei]|uniref:Adenosine 5'-monophosphoramidase HINT3 n=1 Tax=Hypothenemus hampei TaxID=57062 RepID=A0ABD1FCG2_HYPHA
MGSTCIFCNIVAKQSPADVKFENEEIIIFKDISPVATHHYLSIPKNHIDNIKSLNTVYHEELLQRLIDEGKRVIVEQDGDLTDSLLGFHLPPFNTVGHLHLHLISPASSLSFKHRMMFKPNSYWFATADQIQERLHNLVESTKANV